jgi:Phage small terminase subunit
MTSPALRHRQAKLAAIAASGARGGAPGAPAMPSEGPVASEYQMLLMALGEDLRALSNIQSIERKIEAKRAMIDRYMPWLQGALQAEVPAQDEIVTTMLIWLLDLGRWAEALSMAGHVLEHGLALPERYKRNPATLVAEEIAEAGLTNPPSVDLPVLLEVQALTEAHDMHDQVRAKLAKAIGRALEMLAAAYDPEAETAQAGGKPALVDAALDWLNRALALDKNSGVKKAIEGLTRERKKLAEQAGAQTS